MDSDYGEAVRFTLALPPDELAPLDQALSEASGRKGLLLINLGTPDAPETGAVRRYLAEAQRYCPQLRMDDFARHECGIRAQAVDRSGRLVQDFVLERTARMLHVLNAPSPAATAAFPIAGEICRRLEAAA